jgi:probable rRNA maturation factor
MSEIHFFFPVQVSVLRERQQLKKFLQKLARIEGFKIDQLQYVFTSDEQVLKINRSFLKHDDLTDIITFSFSEDQGSISGEVYISVPRVKENAQVFGATFKRELHRVIFHGLLHLCGYKDKLRADQRLMRAREEHYLDLYFK